MNDFKLDKDMLIMMEKSPTERIFDKNNPEYYLKLK